jgi:hypothetical protein
MLSARLSAYLAYFEELAMQPPNHWNGFYVTQLENMGFGLRFQLAFPCYALAAIAMHPQASAEEQTRCCTAMAALIDRMLQRRIWAYWAVRIEQYNTSPDPIASANAQYSGHLAMMIGVYRAAGGDRRYDEGFTLRWSPDDQFTYTYTSLVETLWLQMCANEHHGVECEPGQVRVTTMCHVLWALALHDGLTGSSYAAINTEWIDFMQQRLLLWGARLLGNGIFHPFYTNRVRLMTPLGMSVVDAWVLAFLARLAPQVTSELAPRFLRSIRHIRTSEDASEAQAYVPSTHMWQAREIADQTLATGFGYVLAVELGDEPLAAALLNHADAAFEPTEQQEKRCYRGGLSQAYTTALFALGEAGGLGGFGDVLPHSGAQSSIPGQDTQEADGLEHETGA